MTTSQHNQAKSETKTKKGFVRRNIFWFVLIGLQLIGGIYMIAKYEAKIRHIQEANEIFQEDMEEQVSQFLSNSTEDLLLLSTKGFDWAIRGELIRGNEEQVQQYITQLVKEEKIQQAEFINRDGMIEMASDKKREGKTFDFSEFDTNPLQADEPSYFIQDDGTIKLFAPVLGLEKKLGTLMLFYTPDQFHFQADSTVSDKI